jgi:tRNA-guanine family transglycosylase
MSLSALRKITEHGVTFQSHIDGSRHEMSPERSIEIQGLLGSDIQMQLDECVRLPASETEIERAMEMSLRWAERCKRGLWRPAGQGDVRHCAGRRRTIEAARALGGGYSPRSI